MYCSYNNLSNRFITKKILNFTNHELEYKFKLQAYLYQNKICRRDRTARGLQHDYLNNPANWQRYHDNPKEIEDEWEDNMTHPAIKNRRPKLV